MNADDYTASMRRIAREPAFAEFLAREYRACMNALTAAQSESERLTIQHRLCAAQALEKAVKKEIGRPAD